MHRSSAETILFLQQLGERAPEPRHDPEWRFLPCRSGEEDFRLDAKPKLGVGKPVMSVDFPAVWRLCC